jgi:hypothetical protein
MTPWLQTVKALDDAHAPRSLTQGRMQYTKHLKAAGPHVHLLLNFGRPRLTIKRVAHAASSLCSACIAFLHLR